MFVKVCVCESVCLLKSVWECVFVKTQKETQYEYKIVSECVGEKMHAFVCEWCVCVWSESECVSVHPARC